MSRKTRNRISVAALAVWICCTLGAFTVTAAPKLRERVRANERRTEQVGAELTAYKAKADAIGHTVEARLKKVEERIESLNYTVLLATGALMAVQWILAAKPAFLFRRESNE